MLILCKIPKVLMCSSLNKHWDFYGSIHSLNNLICIFPESYKCVLSAKWSSLHKIFSNFTEVLFTFNSLFDTNNVYERHSINDLSLLLVTAKRWNPKQYCQCLACAQGLSSFLLLTVASHVKISKTTDHETWDATNRKKSQLPPLYICLS